MWRNDISNSNAMEQRIINIKSLYWQICKMRWNDQLPEILLGCK